MDLFTPEYGRALIGSTALVLAFAMGDLAYWLQQRSQQIKRGAAAHELKRAPWRFWTLAFVVNAVAVRVYVSMNDLPGADPTDLSWFVLTSVVTLTFVSLSAFAISAWRTARHRTLESRRTLLLTGVLLAASTVALIVAAALNIDRVPEVMALSAVVCSIMALRLSKKSSASTDAKKGDE